MTAFLLNSMGIVRWRQRRPLPGAKAAISCTAYQLLYQGAPVGALFIDAGVALCGQDEKVANLLDAMLAAIQLSRVAIKLPRLPGEQDNVLIMGAALVEQLFAGKEIPPSGRVIVLRHPLELLQQPLYKKEAWLELQKFQQLFSHNNNH